MAALNLGGGQHSGNLPNWREFARSVRGRFTMLTAALVLTAGLTAAFVALDNYSSQRRETERQLTETVTALSLAVDGRMREANATLRGLATSPYLQARDFAAFDRQARHLVDRPDIWIGVIDRRGQQLVNTRFAPGTPLPNVRNEPEFQRAWEKASPLYISDLGQSGSAPRRYTLEMATVVKIDGRPDYLLAMALPPAVLNELIAQQHLPDRWTGVLLDQNRRVMARNRDVAKWLGRRASPQALAKLDQDHGVATDRNLEGEQSLAAYRHSPFTGWTFLVAVPMREVSGAFARSLLITGAVTLGLLAVGVALAVHMARGMTNAVEALAHSASAMGHGGPVKPVVTGMRETDAVAEALHASSVKLATREEELRRLNETLEERVAQRSHELSEAAASLLHARKAEAIGRLSGGTAHDFNNLLMAVIGNLDLLNKRLGDDNLRKYIDRARQAAERGSKLTAQLLAFARRQRLTVEPMDVAAMIDGMQALLDRSLGGAFNVEIRHLARPAWALGDRSQLELVVLNLALNARDAMPQGGALVIETGRARVEAAPDAPEAPPAGDYVTLSVIDTGAGMTPDVLAQMWEPFFTTKGPSAGSGLGLSQVLGVIKQLGGGARVETAPGHGTRVTVYVPVAVPAEAEAPEPAADLRPADLRGIRVLLVDDDPDVRRTTAALLTDLGCTAEQVDSGPAALARLAEGDPPQLIVMDYAMPGMTGSEAARLIAERWPSLPVLLITGYMEGEALEHAWHGPVLGKPFNEAQLAAQVGALVRSRA